MRYRGGGVGHVETCVQTDVFLTDRDPIDQRWTAAEISAGEAMDVDEDDEPPPTNAELEVEDPEEPLCMQEAEDYDVNLEGNPVGDDELEDELGRDVRVEDDWGPEQGEDRVSELQELGYDEF